MTKDYAKRRRAHPSTTRRFNSHASPKSASVPAVAWTILGLLMGVGLSGVLYWKLHKNTPVPIQNVTVDIQEELPTQAKPAQKRTSAKSKPSAIAQVTKNSSRFDFYTVLPSMDPTGANLNEPTVASNTLELALQKSPEDTSLIEDLPTIVDDEPNLPIASSKEKESAKPEKRESAVSSYVIQAGSFHRLQQAEELKAKLAFSGFEASIQTFKMGAKDTRYRVLIGPYANQDQAHTQQLRLEQSQPLHSVVLKIGV